MGKITQGDHKMDTNDKNEMSPAERRHRAAARKRRQEEMKRRKCRRALLFVVMILVVHSFLHDALPINRKSVV